MALKASGRFGLLLFCCALVGCAMAVSSGNKMRGSNPQLNRQVNNKVLCPDVAPGKTQVWNIEWTFVTPSVAWINNLHSTFDLTSDEEGFIYIPGLFSATPSLLKISGKDGSYDQNESMHFFSGGSSASDHSMPTHLNGNIYVTWDSKTAVLNSTSMKQIVLLDSQSNGVLGNYVPIQEDLLVAPITVSNSNPTAALVYLNATSKEFDTTQPNFDNTLATDVLIYENANGDEIPIIVYFGFNGEILVQSMNYQFTITNLNTYFSSYILENQLIIRYDNDSSVAIMSFYDAETGEQIRTIMLDSTWNDDTIQYLGFLHIFGSKSVASVRTQNNDYGIVDFLNNKTLLTNVYSTTNPIFSIPDSSVVLNIIPKDTVRQPNQVVSIDLNTSKINAIGVLPMKTFANNFGRPVGSPIIGNECAVYAYYVDSNAGYPTLFAFKPLPISNIVPILDCVDDDAIGYFSYQSNEDKVIRIPFVSDRNNLKPMSVAPWTEFKPQQRTKGFPFSALVPLDTTVSSFEWVLEGSSISFNLSEQFRCPQNITLVLYFNSTAAPPSNFTDILSAYGIVLGVNETSSGFNVWLGEVAPNIARSLYTYIAEFNGQLEQDFPNYGITLVDMDYVPEATPPVDVPINAPTGSPSSPNNQPPSRAPSVSIGHKLFGSSILILTAVIITLF